MFCDGAKGRKNNRLAQYLMSNAIGHPLDDIGGNTFKRAVFTHRKQPRANAIWVQEKRFCASTLL